MNIVVGAVFGDPVSARDAISDLRGFGLNPYDISIGELTTSGLMFGTAATMVPGTGGFNANTRSDRLYPSLHRTGASPSMPEGVIAETTADALQMMLDMGLPEDLARQAGQAMLDGHVLVAVSIPKSTVASVGAMLLKNDGEILLPDELRGTLPDNSGIPV